MVKKIFVLLFCFIFCALSCFAEYKPISNEKSKEYKAEIEQIINAEYWNVMNETNSIYNEANLLFNQAFKNPKNFKVYQNLSNTDYIVIIGSPEFNLYKKLFIITGKYVYISPSELETDFIVDLYDFFYPYFNDNNINMSKLLTIAHYTTDKENQLRKKYDKLNKMYYSNKN